MSAIHSPPRTQSRLFSTQRKRRRRMQHSPSMLSRILQASGIAAACFALLLLVLDPLSQGLGKLTQAMAAHAGLATQLLEWHVTIGGTRVMTRFALDMPLSSPDRSTLWLHGAITTAVFAGSWLIRSITRRNILRVLCVLHGIGVAMLALHGGDFPYDVASHTRVLCDVALIGLLLTPWFLAAGFYLVERNWSNRLVGSVLLIAWQVMALPLRLVVHAWLIGLLSTAAIPLLFLVAGPILDVLVFSAMYAWIMNWPPLDKATKTSQSSAARPTKQDQTRQG